MNTLILLYFFFRETKFLHPEATFGTGVLRLVSCQEVHVDVFSTKFFKFIEVISIEGDFCL